MLWTFKEAKNEPFFCIISQESTHFRVMYLGLGFAQTEWSFATDFTGNSQSLIFSGYAEAFLELVVFDFTQYTKENAYYLVDKIHLVWDYSLLKSLLFY